MPWPCCTHCGFCGLIVHDNRCGCQWRTPHTEDEGKTP